MEAGRYDRWFDTAWGQYAFGIERATVESAIGSLDGRLVLEVGCGTGRFTAWFEARAGCVAGVDVDADMLAACATRVGGPVIRADAHRLPFADGAFDVTVAITLCEFAFDPAQVVTELARATRPGGRVVIGALNRRSPWGVAGRRRFRRPPWDMARFLSRDQLVDLATPHGEVTVVGALFSPGVPLTGRLGRALEALGRRWLPAIGAFQVLAIAVPNTRG